MFTLCFFEHCVVIIILIIGIVLIVVFILFVLVLFEWVDSIVVL